MNPKQLANCVLFFFSPTMSITDKKVMCNGGTSADLVAKVAAGGKVTAKWAQ
jgi:hypothetical protein